MPDVTHGFVYVICETACPLRSCTSDASDKCADIIKNITYVHANFSVSVNIQNVRAWC